MSRNHDVSIKNLETWIGQLSKQINALPSSSGGFTGSTVDNPKNETCKVVETDFGVVTKEGEAERVKEGGIKKKEGRLEKEDSGNQCDKEERGFTNYIKSPYPIITKKRVHEDEAGMFEKFKEVLTQLHVLQKGGKLKLTQERVNMTEKKLMAESEEVPPKMKDPRELNITFTIGGLKISHDLFDLGSSINVMSMRKLKELKIGDIILRNMTLILFNSSVTHPLGIIQDVLVNVDGLTFPADFVVTNMKNDSEGSVILGRLFLATGKAKIDVEIVELILKFNKEKVVFNAYE
ncbi:uncharacterized protein LOC127131507 [Lathyrus oleraceus]|uniref:uncharacterized protein LOC127131507 n=1 Tax=Pisum sativum TaxID=3888 RepID=UPI0021CF4678|nr:uncharacterized protein LOC127131507 [Pisum sativum]